MVLAQRGQTPRPDACSYNDARRRGVDHFPHDQQSLLTVDDCPSHAAIFLPSSSRPRMCGIVGLFLKDARLEPELGRLTAAMLAELRDRGPDSAGFAVYGGETAGVTKICVVARRRRRRLAADRPSSSPRLSARASAVEEIEDHAILKTKGDGDAARKWLIDNVPEATVLSQGQSIEIFKGVGDPNRIAERLELAARKARTPSATRAWRPSRPSPSPARIPSRPARTPASCTTARCRTTTACASSSRATASASRPRTTARWRPPT